MSSFVGIIRLLNCKNMGYWISVMNIVRAISSVFRWIAVGFTILIWVIFAVPIVIFFPEKWKFWRKK